MFSLAPARCNGTWHRVSDGEAEQPFSPRLPSCCWRQRGRRPAGRHRGGEPLSTERSRRSAPLDTFDQHISIRFHIRTPAFAQLAPASYPRDWPKWEVRRKMQSKFLFSSLTDSQTHDSLTMFWICSCSLHNLCPIDHTPSNIKCSAGERFNFPTIQLCVFLIFKKPHWNVSQLVQMGSSAAILRSKKFQSSC